MASASESIGIVRFANLKLIRGLAPPVIWSGGLAILLVSPMLDIWAGEGPQKYLLSGTIALAISVAFACYTLWQIGSVLSGGGYGVILSPGKLRVFSWRFETVSIVEIDEITIGSHQLLQKVMLRLRNGKAIVLLSNLMEGSAPEIAKKIQAAIGQGASPPLAQ